jgi:nucleoside-diphosphate-sugar epimerase
VDRPILITGGTGFIGRRLVEVLRAQGTRVRVVARRPDAAAAVAAAGGEPILGDLLDPSVAARAMSGVRAVYHLAGRLFRPGDLAREYERLHVGATLGLVRAAIAQRDIEFFVLCSTTGVHGATGGRQAREDDPGHPENAYERTKARAEQLASIVARRGGLNLVIARPGLVYGPGDRHLLGWFRSIRGGYYRVIGSGRNAFHPIYIDDLVRALLLTASSANGNCRAYHLVGSQPVTMRALSDAIGTAVGRRVPRTHLPRPLAFAMGAVMEALPVPRRALPLTRSRVRFMTESREYDGSRARQELGFIPRVELEDGLARTVAWYRDNGLL